MEAKGIEKAAQRLTRAEVALAAVKKAENWAEFEPAWSDFLLAANAVYSLVEQAAKSNATSRQWFGKKKKERKSDSLLSYMHQARNSDEHGVEKVAEDRPAMAGPMPAAGKITSIRMDNGTPLEATMIGDDGAEITLPFSAPQPMLIDVRDNRFGTVFFVPTHYLGKTIKAGDPYEAGTLLLMHLAMLLNEARAML